MKKLTVNKALLCVNMNCVNTSVHFDESNELRLCRACGEPLSIIGTGIPVVKDDYVPDTELRLRSGEVNWLPTDSVKVWPGPIAFEYINLQAIMKEGSIEAACWKLANLAEVIVAYCFCAALERLSYLPVRTENTLVPKLRFAERKLRFFPKELASALYAVIFWRNSTGVGHGTLLREKTAYVNTIITLCHQLNAGLAWFTEFAARHGMTLCDNAGRSFIGPYYFSGLTGDTGPTLKCNTAEKVLSLSWVIVSRYKFDGPDIYFFDRKFVKGNTVVRQYRNYSKNRVKYLEENSGEVSWETDLAQVAWLDSRERASWYRYLRQNLQNASNLFSLREELLEAAEQFQERGMYPEAREALKHSISRYLCRGLTPEEKAEFDLRREVIKYGLRWARGGKMAEKSRDRIKSLMEQLGDSHQAEQLRFNMDKLDSWYIGFYGDVDRALGILGKLEQACKAMRERYPHSALVHQATLIKNRVYLLTRLPKDDPRNDPEIIRKECLDLFALAGRLYASSPDNENIVDIVGFSCNLYSDASIRLHETEPLDEQEIKAVRDLQRFGLKIRERIYRRFPDDVWGMRGYAWSLHCVARQELGFFDNKKAAAEFLAKAWKIRTECEEKYPATLGPKQDIVKNAKEFLRIEPENMNWRLQAEERIRFIESKEGRSPLVNNLRKLINEA